MQCIRWKDDSNSAGHKISCFFRFMTVFTDAHYWTLYRSTCIHIFHTLFVEDSFDVILQSLARGVFLYDSSSKFHMQFSFLPCVLRAPSVLSSSIWQL
jgi:hypothetical protein